MKKDERFLAVNDEDRFFAFGATPEKAIDKAQNSALDYDGDSIPAQDFKVYEVTRKGTAKIIIDWMSE